MRLLTSVICAAALGLAATTAQAAEKPLTIGVLTDMTSLYAADTGPGSVLAAQMAAEDFGGSVLGRKIAIVSADHQNKPDVGVSIADKWFDTQGVDAIADIPNSGVALAVQNIARQKKKILLMTGPGSSELTGKACSPYGFHWEYDTYALAQVTGGALVKQGGNTWFFITADYAFGHQLQADATNAVEAAGGKILGGVRVPVNTQDFSSFLLQAQASKAKVIGLANAGGDFINSVKQASQFGIVAGGQRLAGLLVFIDDIHSLGLKTAQGLDITTSYYWDHNAETRKFGKRFMAKMADGAPPSMIQAGVYSAVTHYLKAIKAAGTTDPDKVAAEMRKLPVNDFMSHNDKIRPDGLVVRDMYLAQVKSPAESKYDWDYLKILATVPGSQAYVAADKSGCPLDQKS